jgi:ABC-type Mn2+/Zn2+ transport system permease subunit
LAARVDSWLLVVLAVITLAAASVGNLWAQEQKSPKTSLDRAVSELDASGADASDAADSTSAAASTDHAPVNVIRSFVISWRLFHDSYYVGWFVGLMLSLVGVVVVARDQVFIGAAVSQASTLGIALALCFSGVFPLHQEGGLLPHSATWLCCDSFQVTMAVVFSVLAALITSRADRSKRESHEAITGWVFLISASLSVLVVAHSPHGLEEVNRIHSSSIIGATAADVALFGVFLLLTILLLACTGRRLLLFVMDPSMAAAVGMNVGRWAMFESIWLGLVVGLSIRTTGMLFTFGSLVLPPLVAKNVCREVRPMFFVAPVVALITNTVGFVLANGYDFPPAQMNVAILCLLLLLVWGFRRLRRVWSL